jgi:hypothetical protein
MATPAPEHSAAWELIKLLQAELAATRQTNHDKAAAHDAALWHVTRLLDAMIEVVPVLRRDGRYPELVEILVKASMDEAFVTKHSAHDLWK